ncbi:DUF1993 domain-containing protein [Erythrobacter sp. SG61-1L]|uniref:DUF1993 domain-containing protein n=1 Tax=Erythrobacter sp. SG61-1L TaxID=1603897 RepID=UPI001F520B11|nr:DUF1993 domain-containing protein [Erythrobacter sp. SG61-1L]
MNETGQERNSVSYSFHAAVVPSLLQILNGSLAWLAKAEIHAAENGISEEEMMGARLAEDMFPFNRQVRGFAMHAQGGIEGAIKGVFSPDMSPPPATFAGLKARVGSAASFLAGLDPAEVNELVGKPMRFVFGETDLPFTADNFLLSFSQPNFYFHVTTSYAILRGMGVEIGKMDYLANLRTGTPQQPFSLASAPEV